MLDKDKVGKLDGDGMLVKSMSVEVVEVPELGTSLFWIANFWIAKQSFLHFVCVVVGLSVSVFDIA